MNFTKHPRLLARLAGVFYLMIIAFAMFGYVYVRGQLFVPGDIAKTAANIVAHQQLYRAGFTASLLDVLCNIPVALLLFELFKVVNFRLALLAMLFIVVAAAIEAVNVFNYMMPLFILTLPQYTGAFTPLELQALVRGSNVLFGYAFSVCLTFFGVFCVLTGYLILRSKFLPALLGVLMIVAGVDYWTNSFVQFLALPQPPLFPHTTLIVESSLALWLLVIGVNESKWLSQAKAAAFCSSSGQG